jgi:hypothetical protein
VPEDAVIAEEFAEVGDELLVHLCRSNWPRSRKPGS